MPAWAATYRNVNMWQLAIAATNASSGSTCASFEYGFGTTDGEGDAGTMTPPSKVQVCSREYIPFRKSPPAYAHRIVARWSDTAVFRCQAYPAATPWREATCAGSATTPQPSSW